MRHVVILPLPHPKEDLVGGVFVQIEFGLVIVAIKRGPDEFAPRILRVLCFFEGMDIVASGKQKDCRQKEFSDHGSKGREFANYSFPGGRLEARRSNCSSCSCLSRS